MKVIIKNQNGTVGILHPILDCGLTLDEIIAKDGAAFLTNQAKVTIEPAKTAQ